MGGEIGATLGVAVASQGEPFAVELSQTVAECIGSLGHRPMVLRDGDSRALSADVLVILGPIRLFPNLRQLLHRREDRPHTVIWDYDPVPPSSMPRLAVRIGVAAARLSDRLDGLGGRAPWLRPLQRMLPWPMFRFSAACTRLGLHGRRLHTREIHTPFKLWVCLQDVLAEGWVDGLYVTTREKQRFLESRGVSACFAPIGWAPGFGEDLGQERDVDVLFLGGLAKWRRRRRWERLKGELEAEGLRVAEIRRGCYGEERVALLNRTRIMVHLHRIPWDSPWLRWGRAAACGVLVVSEPLVDPSPLRPGVDHVEAPLEEMPRAIRERLADRAGSARMVEACRAVLRDQLSMVASLEKILAGTQLRCHDAAGAARGLDAGG
jgi:hypothetical protein